MNKRGICPVCNGTKRVPVNQHQRPYVKMISGYNAETDTLACSNCGGQTMSMMATGEVNLRPDGTPCTHEYEGVVKSTCYTVYTCSHCGDCYSIDSGD